MQNTVIDLTLANPAVTDERGDYAIDWHRTLLVARAGTDTLVVTNDGQLLLVHVPLATLLANFARRHPLITDAGWFASHRLYQQDHAAATKMTRSYVNLRLALVAYAGGTSATAGYYMRHHLVEAVTRERGLELVFDHQIRVLTTALPCTQDRLAREADEIAHDQRLIFDHVHQHPQADPATARTAEQMAVDYFDLIFEQRYQVRERQLFDHPLDPDWL